MTTARSQRSTVGAVVAIAVALLVWWAQSSGQLVGTSSDPSGAPTVDAGRDPVSGLSWVAASTLPTQAQDTISLIDAGGPYPYPDHDGGTFGNFEGLLPDHERGYYREYTVETPGSSDRGARRIIAGDGDELYWTADHYQSFERIQR